MAPLFRRRKSDKEDSKPPFVHPPAGAARRTQDPPLQEALVESVGDHGERRRLDRDAREAVATIQRYAARVKNPLTALRAMCVRCANGSLKEVAECRVKTCPLHPFRDGKNPFNAKTRARLEREAAIARGETPTTVDEGDDDEGEEDN